MGHNDMMGQAEDVADQVSTTTTSTATPARRETGTELRAEGSLQPGGAGVEHKHVPLKM